MQENQKDPGDEKLLILPLGEESRKITQVISNDTARQIIQLLADAPLSASDISDRLQAPLTTVAYNLENLESVGLVRVEKIKYSEKGRKIKIYAPVRKLIVVVPEKTDRKSVADVLRKYLGMILAAVLASSLVEFFSRSMDSGSKTMQITADNMLPVPNPDVLSIPAITSTPMGIMNETEKAVEIAGKIPVPEANQTISQAATSEGVWNATVTPSDIPANFTDVIFSHPGLLFLLGCLFVIGLLIVLEFLRKREKVT